LANSFGASGHRTKIQQLLDRATWTPIHTNKSLSSAWVDPFQYISSWCYTNKDRIHHGVNTPLVLIISGDGANVKIFKSSTVITFRIAGSGQSIFLGGRLMRTFLDETKIGILLKEAQFNERLIKVKQWLTETFQRKVLCVLLGDLKFLLKVSRNTTANENHPCIHCSLPRSKWPTCSQKQVYEALWSSFSPEIDLFYGSIEEIWYCMGHCVANVTYHTLVVFYICQHSMDPKYGEGFLIKVRSIFGDFDPPDPKELSRTDEESGSFTIKSVLQNLCGSGWAEIGDVLYDVGCVVPASDICYELLPNSHYDNNGITRPLGSLWILLQHLMKVLISSDPNTLVRSHWTDISQTCKDLQNFLHWPQTRWSQPHHILYDHIPLPPYVNYKQFDNMVGQMTEHTHVYDKSLALKLSSLGYKLQHGSASHAFMCLQRNMIFHYLYAIGEIEADALSV